MAKQTICNLARLCPTALFTLFFSTGVLAADYPSGHGALEVFDQAGMQSAPAWVMYWVLFMLAVFVVGLLFVKNHSIARWAVGGMVGSGLTTVMLPKLGVTVLSGTIALCHIIFWAPALYMLLTQRPFLDGNSWFARWAGLMCAVMLFSLVFDIRDAFIYLKHVAGV